MCGLKERSAPPNTAPTCERSSNHVQTYISTSGVAELTMIVDSADGLTIGASAPLSAVEEACLMAGGSKRPGCEGEAARAVATMLRW